MALLKLARHDDPVLAGGVKLVEEVTDDIRKLVDDMIDTMRHGETPGVGLAGPQVGVPLAIVVAEPPPEHEIKEALHDGAIALLNPEIVFSSGRAVIEEGCLSCPGVTVEVDRPSHVIVKGMDLDSNGVRLEVEGALARIFQHEIDHLEGRFFYDHLNAIRRQLVKARIRRT